jgi:hypothetical protein
MSALESMATDYGAIAVGQLELDNLFSSACLFNVGKLVAFIDNGMRVTFLVIDYGSRDIVGETEALIRFKFNL